jgi:Zn-dependent protease with chaperone function
LASSAAITTDTGPVTLGPPPPVEEDAALGIRQGSLLKGLLWILGAFAAVLALYVSLPYLAKGVPWSAEKRAFAAMSPFIAEKTCNADAEANAVFQQVVRRIYPIYPGDKEFPVDAAVIRGKEANAFAFLAGRIYVYDALIRKADSPDELAAVLAHEIEHVKQRHIIQGLIQRMLGVYVWQIAFPTATLGGVTGLLAAADQLKFSRMEEHQADEGALDRLCDAHVNALGFKRFFSKGRGHPSPWSSFPITPPTNHAPGSPTPI